MQQTVCNDVMFKKCTVRPKLLKWWYTVGRIR